MSTSQIRALEDYIQLFDRNARVHVIRTAVELGVIEALATGQKTCAQLASQLKLNEQALELLLNVLCHTEMVERYGDDFALASVAHLIPRQFLDFGNLHWQYLSDFVRSGSRLAKDKDVPISERDFLIADRANQWMQTPAAMDAAAALDFGTSRQGLAVLDVGCGSAVLGVSLLHRDPSSQLVLLDDAAGLANARKTVESVGVEPRVQWVEADYMSPTLAEELDGRKFDLVLLSSVLHMHSLEKCKQLFRNLHPIVAAEGEIAILHVFAGQEEGDARRSIFELEVNLRTEQGLLHSLAEIQSALTDSGFGKAQFTHLPAVPHTWGLVVATRLD